MVEFMTSPSSLKVSNVTSRGYVAREILSLRKDLRVSTRNVAGLGRIQIHLSVDKLFKRKWKLFHKGCMSRCSCCCLGSLADLDGVAAPDLVSMSDQLLLTASIFLTYLAGVIPGAALQDAFPREKSFLGDVKTDIPFSGRFPRNSAQAGFDTPWSTVKQKILDAIDSLQYIKTHGNIAPGSEQSHGKGPLSLYAISDGPRLRLLLATFEMLEKEVTNVFGDAVSLTFDEWFRIFPEVIQKSTSAICITWLMQEFQLEQTELKRALISSVTAKLEENKTILQNIQISGKEDLFGELIYFSKRGSLRLSSSFNCDLFVTYGDIILEDILISIADSVAGIYLDLISIDGDFLNEGNYLGMVLCNMSTRALQKLRNEVALSRWFYQNLQVIVSMYEDRFDLFSLKSNCIKSPSQDRKQNIDWWNSFNIRQSKSISLSFYYVTIEQASLPVKRTRELRALTGWRYYYSLYLELLDISMPVIRRIIDKVSRAISFFLVSLIGRSLGLIYTGIRQSLRWK